MNALYNGGPAAEDSRNVTVVIHTCSSESGVVPVATAGLMIVGGPGVSGAYSLRDPMLRTSYFIKDPKTRLHFNNRNDGCCGFLQMEMLRACGAGNHYLAPMNEDENSPLVQLCRELDTEGLLLATLPSSASGAGIAPTESRCGLGITCWIGASVLSIIFMHFKKEASSAAGRADASSAPARTSRVSRRAIPDSGTGVKSARRRKLRSFSV